MCINVYAIFKDTVLRVKGKILFSPFINYHIYATGMFYVREEEGRKEGLLYYTSAKHSQHFYICHTPGRGNKP